MLRADVDRDFDDDEPDPYRDRPRKANTREVTRLRNELAMTLNHAHEILSKLGHEIGVGERLTEAQERLAHRHSVMVMEQDQADAPVYGDGADE